MKIRRFFTDQWLPADPLRIWNFFADTANLAALTPPDKGFRPGAADGPIYPGQIIVHHLCPIPWLPFLRSSWVTEITHVNPPHDFIDAAPHSPFAFWRHRHSFRPENNGVRISDEVHWALPLDPFSRIAAPYAESQLRSLFSWRQEKLASLFPAKAPD
jgi:ligand-binding SRPBCC domain-containing protein